MSVELKLEKCPFCGGEVYPVYWSRTEKYYMKHYARNKRPCCVDQFELKDGPTCLADVYEAWNRRAET